VSVMRSVLLNQRSTLVSSLQQSYIESLWTIFPNPAKDRLDIRFNEISAGTVIQLSNMTGTIIKKIDVSGTVTSVDVSDLPSGLYCISCQNLGKKLIQKVIIHE
jgi:hypothetical protein